MGTGPRPAAALWCRSLLGVVISPALRNECRGTRIEIRQMHGGRTSAGLLCAALAPRYIANTAYLLEIPLAPINPAWSGTGACE
jgi:hypothetical protein